MKTVSFPSQIFCRIRYVYYNRESALPYVQLGTGGRTHMHAGSRQSSVFCKPMGHSGSSCDLVATLLQKVLLDDSDCG